MFKSRIVFLPFVFRFIGLAIVLIALAMAILKLTNGTPFGTFFRFDADIRVYAIHAILILGFFMIAFSKDHIEDELVQHFRTKAVFFSIMLHAVFFFVFTFTSITLQWINFPAIILMNSIIFVYILAFYILKIRENYRNSNNRYE
ncbi:MAG TPA: hypothetical protein PLK75_00235 [Bacteroidales bacterium]|nr:hypothetical protein [Bacteroidales bacterium]